ncbi:MAG: DNA replication and repair protein RecF [Bacteroidia bacterium]|nr:DNA replication and repair protein RecF [Bacteroidia bacterium]
MILQEFSFTNFRSYSHAHVSFKERIICFIGKNGSGKTNLLDGIYYLAFCKSYFNPNDSQVIKHEQNFMSLTGKFDIEGETLTISCGLKPGQRKIFKKNEKEYQRLSDHIGIISVVMISPTDQFLITEGSDERRKFVDSVIALNDKIYLDNLITYNRILLQRNILLKQMGENRNFDPTVLEILDMQLDEPGSYIYLSRKKFVHEFEELFIKLYQQISLSNEVPSIIYDSDLNSSSFLPLLTQSHSKDFSAWTTTKGIHKDDFVFLLNNFPLKKFASQGQQKTFLLSLKLAQFYWLKQAKGIKPILLLDDIFEKLDQSRVEHLFELVSSEEFGQVFISDTDKKRIQQAFKSLGVTPQFIETPTEVEI